MATLNAERTDTRSTPRSTTLFTVLIGLAGLAVLLQGLWAGMFLQSDNRPDSWVEVHARGGEVAIVLAVLAAVVAFVRNRERRDLWVGSAVLVVVLVLEAYLGGLIGQQEWLTAVHIPLAMAIMGLAVWLPLRSARHRGRATTRA